MSFWDVAFGSLDLNFKSLGVSVGPSGFRKLMLRPGYGQLNKEWTLVGSRLLYGLLTILTIGRAYFRELAICGVKGLVFATEKGHMAEVLVPLTQCRTLNPKPLPVGSGLVACGGLRLEAACHWRIPRRY